MMMLPLLGLISACGTKPIEQPAVPEVSAAASCVVLVLADALKSADQSRGRGVTCEQAYEDIAHISINSAH